MSKIKTGRYEGQPSWLRNCELWENKSGEIIYKQCEILDHVIYIHDNKPYIEKIKNFEYIFRPVYKRQGRRPDDIIVCWNDKSWSIVTMWYKDFDESEWDHAIIMPEEFVGKRIPYQVEFWKKQNVEVLK